MTMTSDDAVDVACTLAPHGPANMMSTFMTRYDYDYNRDPARTGSSSGADGGGNAFGAGMSGDVRNRPIFAHGVDTGNRDDRTTYMVDYTAKDRRVQDMARLAAASLTGSGAAAAPVAGATGDPDNGTAYQRNWYRPGLSAHIARDDGSHPHTSYQDDYQARSAFAAATAAPVSGDPVVYAGAAAVAYNADLLKPHNVVEDDGADLAPKITARESLLPRKPKTANGTFSPVFVPLADHRRTWNDCRPGDGVVGSYSCTSWAYGDPSDAHPLQLPLSLARSLAAHDADVTAHPDKAALLRQLAGKTRAASAGTPLDTCDRTNPQYLATMEQKRCAVSRRLEKEHYVSMSMYKSDYIDQSLLPELAGNHGGPADARDTHASPLATAGEMMAGQLTRTTRELGLLRNAHGTLKSGEAHAASGVSTGVVAAMRTMERAVAIDKADPHRHKLRA